MVTPEDAVKGMQLDENFNAFALAEEVIAGLCCASDRLWGLKLPGLQQGAVQGRIAGLQRLTGMRDMIGRPGGDGHQFDAGV